MASKAMFEQLKKAKKGNGGSNIPIKQGRYRLIVDTVKFPTLFSGDTFIAEFKVKTATPTPGATEDDNATPAVPNAVGSTCGIAYVPNTDPKRKEQVANDIRAFVETLDGEDHNDDEYLELLMSVTNEEPGAPINPARGMEIEVEAVARAKPIQSGPNKGKKFIGLKWKHVETSDEQLAANLAYLDGKADLKVA